MAMGRMQTIPHMVGGMHTAEEILTEVTEAAETVTRVGTITATDLHTLRRQLHLHRLLAQPHPRLIILLNTRSIMPVSPVEIPMQHTEATRTTLHITNTMHSSRLNRQGKSRLRRHRRAVMQLHHLHLGLLYLLEVHHRHLEEITLPTLLCHRRLVCDEEGSRSCKCDVADKKGGWILTAGMKELA